MNETGLSVQKIWAAIDVFNICSSGKYVMEKEEALTFLTECGQTGEEVLDHIGTDTLSKLQYLAFVFRDRGKLDIVYCVSCLKEACFRIAAIALLFGTLSCFSFIFLVPIEKKKEVHLRCGITQTDESFLSSTL